MSIELLSTDFSDTDLIPQKFSCQGENINPELHWVGSPVGTSAYVLLMEDPDVPRNLRPDGLFIHWLVWNIPSSVTSIPQHSEPQGVPGMNTKNQVGYTGPCPPDRIHRYYFRLYALDCELQLPSTATKGEVIKAMNGHVLDQAELMGRFEKTA